MVELSQDTELSLKELLLHGIHSLFLDNLDCSNLLAKSCLTLAHFAKRSLTQKFSELITILKLGLIDTDEIGLLYNKLFFIMNLLLRFFFLLLGRADTVSHFLFCNKNKL